MSSQWQLFINHEQNSANHLYKTFMQAVDFNEAHTISSVPLNYTRHLVFFVVKVF